MRLVRLKYRYNYKTLQFILCNNIVHNDVHILGTVFTMHYFDVSRMLHDVVVGNQRSLRS